MKQFNILKNLLFGMSTTQKLVLSVVAVLIAACATTIDKDEIIFSHNLHSEQGAECADCHSGVSEDAETKVTPMSMDQCADCHDVEDESGCKTCHKNADDPASWQKPTPAPLLFSHQAHEARDAESMQDCASCHSGAATATTSAKRTDMMPKHAECKTCHEKEINLGQCDMCHERLDLYDMAENDFYSHPPGFFERHGMKAAASESNCALCHDNSFCSDCHNKADTVRPSLKFPDKVNKSFMHSGDWMSKHALRSKTDPASCQKCHGVSYCSSCHNRNGIGAGVDQNGTNNPHPERSVWISPGPRSHGAAARKDILSCASCHDQGAASNCVNCHHESMGINPHPPGWKAPVSNSERSSHSNCGICHN
ncbi:MAG: cytochrome c3 family protein [Deltaproteobacteria bacterium]|nr:cytochrome c3 family protein [Deltaproteobacteria bacterium]MBN2674607.1 cytochrome c3 family protein [Deltaproteobacteria bacterium]